ncbi:hypothetical protein GCK72_026005 [Caenorhabditis remanei]|uniref:Uncharacterized protein n=1 Tax=Caenorhabditis remanei TaxID=31234 RepID=A0A6A5G3M9_CAERE|nr:hypothetical protein GCK72_026005 [Caenorhabditis remanei]KAF1749537.1 hypothetical protein GCK72_026005 [Caenorhabditis remanei]
MIYVNGESICWVHATDWCNNISWNVAPMMNNQLTMTIFSIYLPNSDVDITEETCQFKLNERHHEDLKEVSCATSCMQVQIHHFAVDELVLEDRSYVFQSILSCHNSTWRTENGCILENDLIEVLLLPAIAHEDGSVHYWAISQQRRVQNKRDSFIVGGTHALVLDNAIFNRGYSVARQRIYGQSNVAEDEKNDDAVEEAPEVSRTPSPESNNSDDNGVAEAPKSIRLLRRQPRNVDSAESDIDEKESLEDSNDSGDDNAVVEAPESRRLLGRPPSESSEEAIDGPGASKAMHVHDLTVLTMMLVWSIQNPEDTQQILKAKTVQKQCELHLQDLWMMLLSGCSTDTSQPISIGYW